MTNRARAQLRRLQQTLEYLREDDDAQAAIRSILATSSRARTAVSSVGLSEAQLSLAMFALSNENQTTVRCVDRSGESLCDVNLYPDGTPAHYRCRHTPPHCYDLTGRVLNDCP